MILMTRKFIWNGLKMKFCSHKHYGLGFIAVCTVFKRKAWFQNQPMIVLDHGLFKI